LEAIVADETVEVWRIYTGEDGKSRMEPIGIPLGPIAHGAVSKLLAGPGVMLRRMPASLEAEWHNAPRRQLIATIVGEGEVETGDGQVLVTRPGVITVVEDLEGVGHLTRGRGTEDRICLFVPLNDDTQLV
jgi:hypothetical protein